MRIFSKRCLPGWLPPRASRSIDAPLFRAANQRPYSFLDDLDAENHARDLNIEHFDGSWRDREAPRE